MIPVQTYMDQLDKRSYLFGQGHGVKKDPSWPAMFQKNIFSRHWSQMPQLTTTTSPVTSSHTGAPSPTPAIHVGDWSMTSASHVEDLQPASLSYDGGITLVATIHIDVTSPTSIHHVGDDSPASASHAENISQTIVNDVGGIHTIEKPRRLRCKPKFL
jgi:hypothetical protein